MAWTGAILPFVTFLERLLTGQRSFFFFYSYRRGLYSECLYTLVKGLLCECVCNGMHTASFPSEFCTYLLHSPSEVLDNCNLYMTVTKRKKCSQNICHYIALSICNFPLRLPLFLLEVSLYFLAPGIFLRNGKF